MRLLVDHMAKRRTEMKWLLVLMALFASNCYAGERIGVVVPSPEEEQVKGLLERLSTAVDNEDPKAYLACLTPDLAAKNRKKVVLRFLEHDLSMEVEKVEILDAGESTIEFVAKYTVYEDGNPSTVVSTVVAEKAGDTLLLSKEEILSQTTPKQKQTVPVAFAERIPACANGRCPLPLAAVQQKAGPEVPEGISGFNDENGNPDPNGIMWIDPLQLLARFPDKYGVPPCIRAELAREAAAKRALAKKP